jgi:TrmH family RNA methyltransferase
MFSKSKIKLINSLKSAKFRRQHGLFVVEGTTNIIDFLQAGLEIVDLYATSKWMSSNSQKVSNVSVTIVNKNDLKKISFLKHASDVVGIYRIPDQKPFEISQVTDIVLMLDDIRDPGNLGTIIRTADWFGIQNIICSNNSADAYNPKVVQASMGSLSRVSVYYMDLIPILKAKPEYLKVYAAVLNGESIIDIPKPQKAIILIGNEAHGISHELLELVDQRLTIPLVIGENGRYAESLNASIATAIVCYEFRR